MNNDLFNRTELLLGSEAMKRIQSKRVIIFGLGGVGSWCAECLVREGIMHITLVDSDVVCITNCNRQLMATTKTIGEPKVEALRKRRTARSFRCNRSEKRGSIKQSSFPMIQRP